jgi:predicted RNase H-like nuclease (RuvC/YqgF family)
MTGKDSVEAATKGGATMAFWEKVKTDVQKGFKEGLAAIREKAEELTEEGKKKYKLFELKNRVQKEMADLGGSVYRMRAEVKNLDKTALASIERIEKLEAQIEKLEGPPGKTARKKAAPRKAAVKRAPAKRG